jgi:hypothetical protein
MTRITTLLTICSVCSYLVGCTASPAHSTQTSKAIKYAVKIHEFEGCECNSVCPCVFSSNTTFGDCRNIVVFTITEGTYGTLPLKDLSFVLVQTWAGNNMEGTMGKWKGVLYTADKGTPAEHDAITGLLPAMIGNNVFATLEQRTAPIQIRRQGDVHEVTAGTFAHLRIHGVKGPNGEITKVLNAPSPIAYPVMFCALADVNTYNDGKSSWSFSGKNGFFADFELSNLQSH